MLRTIEEVAKALHVHTKFIMRATETFHDHLSASASLSEEQAKLFTDEDLLALLYIAYSWDQESNQEDVKVGLNRREHHNNEFIQTLYRFTPILQTPPERLDESWRHGILLVGGRRYDRLELARQYRQVAEDVLKSATGADDLDAWAFAILHAYRHALELYLKLLGEIKDHTHSLTECVAVVEAHRDTPFPDHLKQWIIEFDTIDPSGTAFRYSDVKPFGGDCAEYWVDFAQFEYAMTLTLEYLDAAILHSK